MKRNSNARFWQVSIAMALFGALAACSGANADESSNAGAEATETPENAESLTSAPGNDNVSSSTSPTAVNKCPPYQVCCEPYPPRPVCTVCRSDYRYCP